MILEIGKIFIAVLAAICLVILAMWGIGELNDRHPAAGLIVLLAVGLIAVSTLLYEVGVRIP